MGCCAGTLPTTNSEITISFEKSNIKKTDTTNFINNNKTPNQTLQQTLQQSSIIIEVPEEISKKEKETNKSNSLQKNDSKKNNYSSDRLPYETKPNENDSKSMINQSEIEKSRKSEKGPSIKLKVGPEIFVSMKKGSFSENYELGKTLGEGAFGTVCLVTNKNSKIVRAMKSMKKSSLIKEEETKMFSEMHILKNLDHPNILKLYELYQDEENYYLITEYCSGGELFDKIKKLSSFSEKMAAEYMKQLLSAVVYCHSLNIVHRDLKPENLLFDSNADNAILKVIDFGTSRKFENDTKMTKRLGTPYYIAPEVLNKNYNEKCDVWSCGIILYILLCGYPPFTGHNEEEILKKVKIGKFEFDPEDWSKVSTEAKDLINQMLTINPKDRIKAIDAINNKWIQQNAPNIPLNSNVLANLGNFHSKTKLQAALYTFIATQLLTQAEKVDLQNTFQSLDKDGDGKLSLDELIEGYTKIYGENEKNKAINLATKIMNDVDNNNSGSIDYSEFLVAALNEEKLLSKARIESAFKMFDSDGNGYITREELENIMGGVPLDEETWKAILEESDTNHDGFISSEEFVELLIKKFV